MMMMMTTTTTTMLQQKCSWLRHRIFHLDNGRRAGWNSWGQNECQRSRGSDAAAAAAAAGSLVRKKRRWRSDGAGCQWWRRRRHSSSFFVFFVFFVQTLVFCHICVSVTSVLENGTRFKSSVNVLETDVKSCLFVKPAPTF